MFSPIVTQGFGVIGGGANIVIKGFAGDSGVTPPPTIIRSGGVSSGFLKKAKEKREEEWLIENWYVKVSNDSIYNITEKMINFDKTMSVEVKDIDIDENIDYVFRNEEVKIYVDNLRIIDE
tara:strand:+ start:1007 stop:1369 length:363 start_codon:yes stop_codon:yes gene_type:complete